MASAVTVRISPMRKRPQLKTGIALASTLVALGPLAGCGDSSSDDPATQEPTGTTTATGTTGTTPAGDSAKGKPAGDAKDEGKNGGQKGRNPASAGDKRGKAPDDAISERPGGPGPKPVSP